MSYEKGKYYFKLIPPRSKDDVFNLNLEIRTGEELSIFENAIFSFKLYKDIKGKDASELHKKMNELIEFLSYQKE